MRWWIGLVRRISFDGRSWDHLCSTGKDMKRLFVSQSLIEIESLKELLSTDGILCTIRNQQGSSLAGEVPFVEVFPELWVVNDADFDRAKELLEEQGSGDEVERPT